MRARDRDDVPAGAGAEHAVERGLVGIGDALPAAPRTIDDAVAAAALVHGAKAGRMLRRFAELPDGTSSGPARPPARTGSAASTDPGATTTRTRRARSGCTTSARPAGWRDRRRGRGPARRRRDLRARRAQPAAHPLAAAERRTAELWRDQVGGAGP
jgi:hypothetical protein